MLESRGKTLVVFNAGHLTPLSLPAPCLPPSLPAFNQTQSRPYSKAEQDPKSQLEFAKVIGISLCFVRLSFFEAGDSGFLCMIGMFPFKENVQIT